MLTVFLPIKERWPSTKAESNRRDPSGLSGLGIDLLYTGGFGPSNKQCIFFDENEDPLWTVNGLHSVLYSNLSNTIEHVGLDCPVFSCVKHTCSEHFDKRANLPHLTGGGASCFY